MDAPAIARGGLRDRFEQRVAAPLRAVRPVLHLEARPGRLCGDRVGELDLRGRAHRLAHESRLDHGARVRRQRREQRLGRTIDQRMAIPHRHREADAQADVARCACHFGHFGRQIGEPLRAGVMHHHGADAAERAARERDGGGEIGIDRGKQREIMLRVISREERVWSFVGTTTLLAVSAMYGFATVAACREVSSPTVTPYERPPARQTRAERRSDEAAEEAAVQARLREKAAADAKAAGEAAGHTPTRPTTAP